MVENKDPEQWKNSVLSVIEGSSGSKDEGSSQVKKLRKAVLLSMQLDADDKAAKKQFKRTIQALEEEGALKLDAEGVVTLAKKKSKKRKLEKKESKKKKKKLSKEPTTTASSDPAEEHEERTSGDDEQQQQEEGADENNNSSQKNEPCRGNPSGVTRLFLGNLPFAVDEGSLDSFFGGSSAVTHIKWITDQQTGKFYGSAFVEMKDSRTAADAVAKAGSPLMGRPIKVNFAPARPGDVWPPPKRVMSGNSSNNNNKSTTTAQAGGRGIQAMSAPPENCTKLFMGNCSFEIDDDTITKFFENVDAEVKAVRWLHHKDSGDFKGCGFAEFWNTEACQKAATLNGKTLLGRPIRLDWTD